MHKMTRSTRKGWEASFAFPPIAKEFVGDLICSWVDPDWTYCGDPVVGVFPPSFVSPENPMTSIIPGSSGYKMYTENGASFTIKEEFVRTVDTFGDSFTLVLCPSAYNVQFGIARFKILGFLGYSVSSKKYAVFNVRNLTSVNYGVEMLNATHVFGQFDNHSACGEAPTPDMPGYSVEGAKKPEPKFVVDETAKSLENQIKAVEKLYPPEDPNRDIAEQAIELLENQRARTIRAGSIPKEKEVTQVIIIDGKMMKQLKRKSSLDKMQTYGKDVLEALAQAEAAQREVEKQMGMIKPGHFESFGNPQEEEEKQPVIRLSMSIQRKDGTWEELEEGLKRQKMKPSKAEAEVDEELL